MVVTQLEASEARLAHNFPLHAGLLGDIRQTLHAINEVLASTLTKREQEQATSRNQTYAAALEAQTAAHTARLTQAHARSPMDPAVALNAVVGSGTLVVNTVQMGFLPQV